MEIRDRIAKRKELLHLTTEDLSKKSGVPTGTINKILNGETPNPRLSTAKALALALECTLDYLTGESDMPVPYIQAASTPLGTIDDLSEEDLKAIDEYIELRRLKKRLAEPETDK